MNALRAPRRTDVVDEYASDYLREHPVADLLLVLSRSKNKNIVVYRATRTAGGALSGMRAHWLDIDPAYLRDGVSPVVELGLMESALAFGFACTPRDDGGGFDVDLTAAPHLPLTLCEVEGRPRLLGTLRGRTCALEWAAARSTEGFLRPTVERVDVLGRDLRDGAEVVDVLRP